jgi:hypothetical protein
VQLRWHKSPAGDWWALEDVNLGGFDQVGAQHGVFVIWRNGAAARMSVVLYVGRGFLPRALADCRRDPIFRAEHGLRVTWASLDPGAVDSVAAYLYDRLRPIWGEVVPSIQPTPVNLPLTA